MDHATFMGVYRTKDDAQRGVFPTLEGGVFWQVWQMPDGNVMLQGIDADDKPVGEVFLVEQAVFLANTCVASPADDALMDADAPDLLFQWYEQALIEAAPGRATPSDYVRTLSGEQQERLWKEMLHTPSGVQPASGNVLPHDAAASPIAEEPAEPVPAQEEKPAAPITAEQPAQPDTAFDEARADIVEAAMRTEFHVLLEKLRQSDPVDVVSELEQLIMRREMLTWRQKYMFTEFGLELRRERQYTAALACHLRALELAPRDAHVLFNVARAEYELGQAASARGHLEQALEVAPRFTAAKNFLDFLHSGV